MKILILGLVFISLALAEDVFWSSVKPLHVSPANSRIIGGDEVVPHSYPFQAGLLINGNAFCGGSLISPNYVVTAAHCGEVIRSVDVILGAHNITDDSEPTRTVIAGESVIIHENYGKHYENDIALIKLAEPVTLNEYIQVVPLPPLDDKNETYLDENTIAIGWGLTYDIARPSIRDLSPVLKSVEVQVIDIAECIEYYYDPDEDIHYTSENNICTSGYKNKGTCNGDSGGPLIRKGVLVGLTSFGTDLCEVCSPSVFTRIGAYLEWIGQNSDVVIN